jgi:hypothetical protein
MCAEDLGSEESTERIAALLAMLDHPAPVVPVSRIVAEAEARGRPGALRPLFRWAAAIALTFGAAGIALAAPGSPVLRWVRTVAVDLGLVPPPSPLPGSAPSPASPRPRSTAGIALSPAGRLVVVLTAAEGGAAARVSLTSGLEVGARAPSGAATFTTGSDRLLVELQGKGDTLTLTIPRLAARVEVFAGPTRVLVAARGSITTTLLPDSAGAYTISVPSVHAP